MQGCFQTCFGRTRFFGRSSSHTQASNHSLSLTMFIHVASAPCCSVSADKMLRALSSHHCRKTPVHSIACCIALYHSYLGIHVCSIRQHLLAVTFETATVPELRQKLLCSTTLWVVVVVESVFRICFLYCAGGTGRGAAGQKTKQNNQQGNANNKHTITSYERNRGAAGPVRAAAHAGRQPSTI